MRRLAIVTAVLLAASACAGDPQSTTVEGRDTTIPGSTAVTTAATSTTAATESGPASPGDLSFTDVTAEAGVTFVHGTPFDEENYTPAMDSAKMIGGAVAADLTGDGLPDLFVIGGGLEDDAFFVNLGDGTFEDRAETAGLLGERHLGSGAVAADYDGDGDLDLFVTSHGTPGDPQPGAHRLFRNEGDGTFIDVAGEAGVATTAAGEADGFGASFGDIDLDGDLDLFVTGWVRDSQGNRLFRNEGDGTFTDITDTAGIVDDGIRGFSPCIVDTNGDRYPEILVVADFGTSRYFINRDGETFREATIQSGVGLEWSGMGSAVADFDGDGRIDWLATAIFDDDAAGRGDGNKLYLNRGRHNFEEAAAGLGLDDGGWGWGPAVFDADLDGRIDVIENNGWNFQAYTDEAAKVWVQGPDGTFTESAAATGLDAYTSFGLSTIDFDYDGDGDRDVALTAPNDAFRLFRTEAPSDRGWLEVVLDSDGAQAIPPGGIGSIVTARIGDTTQTRFAVVCATYLGHGDPALHFGLGDAHLVDELIVEWPDGTVTRITGLAADRRVTITPGGLAGDL